MVSSVPLDAVSMNTNTEVDKTYLLSGINITEKPELHIGKY